MWEVGFETTHTICNVEAERILVVEQWHESWRVKALEDVFKRVQVTLNEI